MIKKFYLQHSWPLNSSACKNIWSGISMKTGKPSAQILIYGENGGITLSREQFVKFQSHGSEIYNYLNKKTTKLQIDLSDELHNTTVTGRVGRCTMLCFSQTNIVSRQMMTLCLGHVSVDRLFSMQYLISYHLEKIDTNIDEICEFVNRFKPQIENDSVDFEDCNNFSNNIDYKLFLHELCSFPNGIIDCKH